MGIKHKAIIFCALVAMATGPVVGADYIASSTFDGGNEAWRLVSTLGYDAPAAYSATDGNPGGFIYGQDPDGGAFGFAAPTPFLGDISAAYGHDLTFDVAAYEMPDQPTSWAGLRGANGLELICYYNAPTAVLTWQGRSVPLTETAWVRVSDGQPPTYTQFTTVLGNVEALVILTEFVVGLETDISGLDNVTLVPEPTTLALLTVSGLALIRRKRTA